MAGIKITGLFTPGGEFPLLEDKDLKGGFRVVETITDRNNIYPLDRKWGMFVYVIETDTIYVLQDTTGDISDNSNWVELQLGNPYANVEEPIIIKKIITENTNYVSLGRWVFKDKSLFKVYKNGSEVNEDDWDFANNYVLNHNYSYGLNFTFQLEIDDIIVIEYVEKITISNNYNLKLAHYDNSISDFRVVNNKMIPKTAIILGNNYYLDNIEFLNEYNTYIKCIYKGINNPSLTKEVFKIYNNHLFLGEFNWNETFPDGMVLEIWKRRTNYRGKYSSNKPPKSKGTDLIPHKETTINKFKLQYSAYSNDFNSGLYYFRFRKGNSFSKFFNSVLSIRRLPIFTTDATLSEKTFKGYFITSKII